MKVEAKQEMESTKNLVTGADVLIDALVKAEVDTIFGYPGGAVLPIYDAIYRSNAPFEHVLSRHEQGSIHAAEGYARVTGKPGVVIATSGPGATNLVTGITDAMMDSLPLVIFTGQVANSVIGTDAFQEADVMGITTPITKYNYQVTDLLELPKIVKEAFHIASTGRPGPVVVDIPKNISSQLSDAVYDDHFVLPGYQPNKKPNPLQITKLTEALSKAKRPLILAGAGVVFAKASEPLIAFAEKFKLPVANTLLGLGSFPGSHELSLGMAGMHGTYAANMAIYECDLLINIGARFDDRLTGNLNHFAPVAKVAHIDIDPAEIGKNVSTEIPVVADAKEALQALLQTSAEPGDQVSWRGHLATYQREYPLWYDRSEGFISPQWLIEQVHQLSNGEAIVTTDVGQHQMWAAQYYLFEKPNRWVTSGGLGTMGFGFPAAIGAQLGAPEELVVSIVGDGGFQMTFQELSVVKEKRLPVKVIIVNNQALGMVRQWQESFYEKRYSESLFMENPDFVKLSDSYGIRGMRVEKEKDVPQVLQEALTYDGPVVVDCRVVQETSVYPMIAPGKGIHEMIGVRK
ncbi:acetolactate synthase large subunit [Virgibacillus pantothenticus]|uniref:acetolactate synthase large subunit n=1 Tax=Virgibacillus pantothenticus TaxID=1473 RepID=UPI001B2AC3A0|nr:acetolactate synthase large subunit [Virgibacillus pantothenticus]MBU8565829.1 acetolactate synthase large subunit [Virgibacillus pantothenticus]MBU8599584.1 acetolactate synthase large subunit [Virgibacillus pantothenticus]MBU8634031.1 acetolactate synthase large subunit [Virgibacillus pantothenticus]MBU8642071.1 acetolactate synthase large subunit [Virgibacillus pantothenticus]MBU8645945.1 acetolactate synthase large subunit [Virgibacillus pantothenticus]